MLQLTPVNALALQSSADALVVNALTYGADGLPAPVSGEVRAAHATVIAGASQVAAAWSPILAPLKVQVKSTAILIHGSPKVDFCDQVTGEEENRELADVLLVVDLMDGGHVSDRRAALTQAKLTEKTGHISLGPSGKAQRNLYLYWPEFTMPKGYGQQPRDLNDGSCPGLAPDGCRFGGIDLHGTRRDWTQVPTAQKMNVRKQPSLGNSLMEMARGSAGRPAVAGGKDPWSELIDELMTATLNVTYPNGRGPKISHETVSFLLSDTPGRIRPLESVSFFRSDAFPPEGDIDLTEDAGPPRGISLIHIELIKFEDRG